MKDKKSNLQKFAEQLQQWDAEVDVLKAKAKKAKTEHRNALHKQIEGLRVRNETARDTLKRLQTTSDGSRGSNESWRRKKIA